MYSQKGCSQSLLSTQKMHQDDDSDCNENKICNETDLLLSPTQPLTDDDSETILSPNTLISKLKDKEIETIVIFKKRLYPPEIVKIPNATWSITQLKIFIERNKLNIDIDLNEKELLNAILTKINN